MILGVTGGIATGKSSVAARLKELGALVIDADVLAREAVARGSDGLRRVVERFGPGVLDRHGGLDREALAQRVFSDDAARADLEAILHPIIADLSERRLAEAAASGAALVVYESPLLFEAGAEDRVDKVLVVTLDRPTQMARLAARDQLGDDAAMARIEAQMPLGEKVARADYVLDNSGSAAETAARVDALYHQLVSSLSRQPD